MQKNVKIKWFESTSKTGKTFDYIEYVFEDKENGDITITKDFEMNDIKRYVLRQIGIVKEVR